MAKYLLFKSKRFKLKKEAVEWTKKIKKASPGLGLKIETNYHASEPMPWEGVVLKRE